MPGVGLHGKALAPAVRVGCYGVVSVAEHSAVLAAGDGPQRLQSRPSFDADGRATAANGRRFASRAHMIVRVVTGTRPGNPTRQNGEVGDEISRGKAVAVSLATGRVVFDVPEFRMSA